MQNMLIDQEATQQQGQSISGHSITSALLLHEALAIYRFFVFFSSRSSSNKHLKGALPENKVLQSVILGVVDANTEQIYLQSPSV